MRAGESAAVGAGAPEVRRDHGFLGSGDLSRLERLVETGDDPRIGRREGDVDVSGHGREPADRAPVEGFALNRAARAGREHDLSLVTGLVESLRRDLRAVAELRVARPEVDAGRRRLVRVVLGRGLAPHRPAPRPDRAETELFRDLFRGKRLQLRDLQPREQRRVLAPTRARRRVEAEHDPELARRDAHRGVRRDAVAEERPQRPAAGERALLRDARGGEVGLADDVRVVRDLPPPVAGDVAGVRHGGDQQHRMRTPGRERLEVDQDVAPVLGVRGAPGRDQVRAVELVLGDHRLRAPHRHRGRVVHPVRPVDHVRRIERLERRADPADEVQVEVDRLRAVAPEQLGIDEVRGRPDHAGPRKDLPEGNRAVGEVDPERSLVGDPAGLGRGSRPGRSGPVRHSGERRARRKCDENEALHPTRVQR